MLRYSCVTQDNSINGKVQSVPLLSSKPFLANHFSPLHTIVVHVCMFDFFNPFTVQKKKCNLCNTCNQETFRM